MHNFPSHKKTHHFMKLGKVIKCVTQKKDVFQILNSIL